MANPDTNRPIVLNDASLNNVLGYTIPWWLMLGFFVGVGVWRLSLFAREPLFALIFAAITLLPLGILIQIFFFGGKSVTVLNDEMIVELWISKIFKLNRKRRIGWHEIERAEYRTGRADVLRLYTSRGRFTFWTLCSDPVELRYLRAILTERLGGERVTRAN